MTSVEFLAPGSETSSPEEFRALTAVPDIETEHHTTHISGGTVQWDMAYRADTDPCENPIVVLRGGFSTTKENYAGLSHEVAALGYTAINCGALRNLPLRKALHPTHAAHPLRRQSQAIWGVVRELPSLGFERTPDLVGHSMGGWIVLDAALHHPDNVGTVVMFEAAALGHGRREIVRDFTVCVATDLLPNSIKARHEGHTPRQLSEIVQQLGHYGLQVACEGIEIMGKDARKELAAFTAAGHAVRFVFGDTDRAIGAKYHPGAALLDPELLVIHAGHGAPQFQPGLSAHAIHQVLQRPATGLTVPA